MQGWKEFEVKKMNNETNVIVLVELEHIDVVHSNGELHLIATYSRTLEFSNDGSPFIWQAKQI